jgi:predicted DNA-binding transcriptional regulator AlpA
MEMPTHQIAEPLVLSHEGLRQIGIHFTNQHLLRLEANGKFPRRASLADRKVCWVYSEIREWLAKRINDREALAGERSRAALHSPEIRSSRRPAGLIGDAETCSTQTGADQS